MIIHTQIRYAVMAMADLAIMQNRNDSTCPKDAYLSVVDIADRQNIPEKYLNQIFASMRKKGLLHSGRGMYGGYKLAKKPSDIYLSDIVDALDQSMKVTRCQTNNTCEHTDEGCMKDGKKCNTHDVWAELETIISLYFNRVSLEDICIGQIRKIDLKNVLNKGFCEQLGGSIPLNNLSNTDHMGA
jgi:Rrf2 family iron-sulfur cluster assembly transcriptional regulator